MKTIAGSFHEGKKYANQLVILWSLSGCQSVSSKDILNGYKWAWNTSNRRPKGFCKKGVLKNFVKFAGKNLCQSVFFNKVADLMPEKKPWHSCFPVNFGKILKTLFVCRAPRWLLSKHPVSQFRDQSFPSRNIVCQSNRQIAITYITFQLLEAVDQRCSVKRCPKKSRKNSQKHLRQYLFD